MSNLHYEQTPEPDILQLNMETISRELNDLIVGGEMEFGLMTQHAAQQQQNFINSPHVAATNGLIMQVKNYQVPQYRMTHYYQQSEQVVAAPPPGLQNMTPPNLNHMATYPQPILGSAANNNNGLNNSVPYAYISPNAPYLAGGANILSHSTVGPSVYAQSPPKYEFHYLRPQDHDKTNTGAAAFHNTTARDDFGNRSTLGAYRKYQRPANKHNNKTLTQCLDYDKIIVDLSLLGWSQDGKEINPVLRIFALLRNLYNAVAEVPPSFEPLYDSEYEPTFAPMAKSRLPRTMNVQYQVKQACRKVTIFVCEMERLLNANKMYDHNLYAETELYLINLRQLLTQFEMYKRMELEHKRGQFIKEDVKVHAENLELLLEHINRQIREVHIRIIACDWFIGITYRGEGRKAASSSTDGPSAKRSKIGVLNEIIQLCNTTTTTTTTKTPTNNTTITATGITSSITKTATEFEFGKPQNNKIFDNLITSTTTTAAAVSSGLKTYAAATFNTRQPVFYIG